MDAISMKQRFEQRHFHNTPYPREKQIMEFVQQNAPPTHIAIKLGIRVRNVKKYLREKHSLVWCGSVWKKYTLINEILSSQKEFPVESEEKGGEVVVTS